MERMIASTIYLMLKVVLTGTLVAMAVGVPALEAQSRPPRSGLGGMYVQPSNRTQSAPRTPGPVYGNKWRLPPAQGPRLSPYYNQQARQGWLRNKFNKQSGGGGTGGSVGKSAPPASGTPPVGSPPAGPSGPRFKPPGW
jgi:hypothetical protein